MGTLSERFSKLKNAGSSGSTARGARVGQRTVVQQNKREAQTQQRRTGTAPAPRKNNNTNNKRVSVKKGVTGPRSGAKDARGKGKKGGRKPNGKGGKKGADKTPNSAMDLDKDMDTYWFKGGKGKDPNLLALDSEMDEYHKGKLVVTAPTA